MTLEIIKTHMLNYFSSMDLDDDDYYDDTGHAGGLLLAEIESFWERFFSDKDFMYVVSGRWASDDLNLDGGRDYFFSSSGVIPMLFDYLYNTLGYSLEQYRECIWNDVGLTEDIEELYDNPAIIRDSRINQIFDDEVISPETKLDTVIVLKYPKEMKEQLDLNPIFNFVGLSKIDNQSPIYTINVPKGYEIVPILNDSLK